MAGGQNKNGVWDSVGLDSSLDSVWIWFGFSPALGPVPVLHSPFEI